MEIKEDTKGIAFRESPFTNGLYFSFGILNAKENIELDKVLILHKEISTLDAIKDVNLTNVLSVYYLHELLTESKIELY